MITDIAHGEADLETLKAGASLIPAAKITKVPKVVKAIGNVGKTGFKKGKEGEKIAKSGQVKQTKAKNKEGSEADVNWTDHGHKHFPGKNKSWKDIVKSTKNGPAKYSPDIKDIEAFEREAWETGTPVTNGKNWKVKKYNDIIGATGGKETQYIRIENSANIIHGHPIFESEYLKLLK